MAVSIVQSAIAHVFTAGGHNTLSVTFTNPVGVGNLLLVFAISDNIGLGATPGPPTDSLLTSFSTTRGPDTDNNGNSGSQIWQGVAPSGGSDTITVSGFQENPFSNAIILIAIEISGSNPAGITSVFNQNDSGTFPLDSTSISANSGDLILGFGGTESFSVQVTQITYTPAAGFVIVQQLSSVSTDSLECTAALISQTAPSTGSFDPQMTPNHAFSYWLMSGVVVPASSGTDRIHEVDAFLTGPTSRQHNVDAFLQPASISFLQEADALVPPITDPNAFIKEETGLAQPALSFIDMETELQSIVLSFLQMSTTLVAPVLSFLKQATNLIKGNAGSHNVDADLATSQLGFINMACNLLQPFTVDDCGQAPDSSFIKMSTWLVQAGDSVQAPGAGLKPVDDWLSQVDALGTYQKVAQFKLAGIPLIVTGYTTGVISYQTRTRQWLRLVDAAPAGVVVTEQTSTRQLANGQIITTVTQTKLVQDVTITTVTTTYGGTSRVSTSVTQVDKNGKQITQETETNTINGIRSSLTKKTVTSIPPTSDNVQPLQVKTLDGVIHYQFFGSVNEQWAGGEQEGLTTTNESEQIVPGVLNGKTTDANGNPIYNKITDTIVDTPDGKEIHTHTEEIGTRRDVGTIITNTEQDFNGIVTTTTTTTKYPDGSSEVKTTVTNNITGESTETTVETDVDETGLATTITTVIDTKTATNPTTGALETTITKTVTTSGPTGTTTDTTTTTRNNFEDVIAGQKIKVYHVQEFTLNCVIDSFSMQALLEIQIDHQRNFAIVELTGQQLGNLDLSWPFRQNLIQQFNDAMDCIESIELQALGHTYEVVFAPSAASFRAKYIPGTLPPVYELQMIVQERSDVVMGLTGF